MTHDLSELKKLCQDPDFFFSGETVAKLIQVIEMHTEALEFYASNDSWICPADFQFGDGIASDDLEENSPISKRRFVGGKRAREALSRAKEVLK